MVHQKNEYSREIAQVAYSGVSGRRFRRHADSKSRSFSTVGLLIIDTTPAKAFRACDAFIGYDSLECAYSRFSSYLLFDNIKVFIRACILFKGIHSWLFEHYPCQPFSCIHRHKFYSADRDFKTD